MGITIIKFFIWGGISWDIRSTSLTGLRLRVAVKLNSGRYTRRYTSPNENFEYSYPLNMLPRGRGYFWPQGHNPQGDATYQISWLKAEWFQTRFFHVFPSLSLC